MNNLGTNSPHKNVNSQTHNPDYDIKNNEKGPDSDLIQNDEMLEDFIKFDDEDSNNNLSRDLNSKKINTMFRSDNIEVNEERVFAPWISEKTMNTKQANIRLHNEILEFTSYISPSKQDYEMRLNTIKR